LKVQYFPSWDTPCMKYDVTHIWRHWRMTSKVRVFHNAQWYWSDNLCKLVTDQWRASLGVRDSESCWFTEEMCTYMRCWESPGDLPLVIEICFFSLVNILLKVQYFPSWDTPYMKYDVTHIWRHWRMTSKVRKWTSRNTKKWKK
jgi:hypothetical protein